MRNAQCTRRLGHLRRGQRSGLGQNMLIVNRPLLAPSGSAVLPKPVLIALAGCANNPRALRGLLVATGKETMQADARCGRQTYRPSTARVRPVYLMHTAVRGGLASWLVPVTSPDRFSASPSRCVTRCWQGKSLERRRKRRPPIAHIIPLWRTESCMLCTAAVEASC